MRAVHSFRLLAGRTSQLELLCLRSDTFTVQVVTVVTVVAPGDHQSSDFSPLAFPLRKSSAQVPRLLRPLQHPVPTHRIVRFHRKEKPAPTRWNESWREYF